MQALIRSVTRIDVPNYKHTDIKNVPSLGILRCEISNQLFLWSSQPVTPILFKALADLLEGYSLTPSMYHLFIFPNFI